MSRSTGRYSIPDPNWMKTGPLAHSLFTKDLHEKRPGPGMLPESIAKTQKEWARYVIKRQQAQEDMVSS